MKPTRHISTAFIIGLLFLCNLPIATAEDLFPDVNSNTTYQTGIEYLYNLGIINGNSDGTYKPNNTLNRAEMLKILVEATLDEKPSTSTTKCFNDVPVKEWYTPYVCYGKDQGWVIGYDNGENFKPEQTVSVVEALKMTLEAFSIKYETDPEIWYKDIVNVASESNYIPFDVNSFTNGFQRGQMADLITRVIKSDNSELDEYLGDRKTIVVSYKSIEEGQTPDLQTKTPTTEQNDDMKAFNENQESISSMIKDKIEEYSLEKEDVDSTIEQVKTIMQKYPTATLVQTSGQSLLDECNDLLDTIEKLIETGNDLIQEAKNLIDTGKVTDYQKSLVEKFANYVDQYNDIYSSVLSKISTFTINEKSFLEDQLDKKGAELERKQAAMQILNQLVSLAQDIEDQLTELDSEMEKKQTEIDDTYNLTISMPKITLLVEPLIAEYNELVKQWNTLLDGKDLITSLRKSVEDYYQNGTPLSSNDKVTLTSLGISF